MRSVKPFNYEAVTGFRCGDKKAYVYCYFIDGLLIDTGQSNAKKAILSTLQTYPIHQIFITHHHEDHSGNVANLQKHFNCPAYGSSKCVEFLKKPPRITIAQQLSWGYRSPYHQLIGLDDVIKTPNYSFQIIPIPGHAADQVALYEPREGWLFSADLYVHHYIKYMMQPESIATQIDSIRRILALDFKVLFCAHNPQLTNSRQQLEKKLVFLEGFYRQVAELHRKGYTPTAIMKRMDLKENWYVRILSENTISAINMVKAVIRDELKIHN